jgi:hypothetical protein
VEYVARGWLHFVVFTENLLNALIQTSVWAMFWMLGFWGSSFALSLYNQSQPTTALAITAGVIAGYSPKVMSMIFNSDSDFTNLIHGRRSIYDLPWLRLLLSLALFAVLFTHLIPTHEKVLTTEFPLGDIINYLKVTGANWKVVACIFAIQLVYSWPGVVTAEVVRTSAASRMVAAEAAHNRDRSVRG